MRTLIFVFFRLRSERDLTLGGLTKRLLWDDTEISYVLEILSSFKLKRNLFHEIEIEAFCHLSLLK